MTVAFNARMGLTVLLKHGALMWQSLDLHVVNIVLYTYNSSLGWTSTYKNIFCNEKNMRFLGECK